MFPQNYIFNLKIKIKLQIEKYLKLYIIYIDLWDTISWLGDIMRKGFPVLFLVKMLWI